MLAKEIWYMCTVSYNKNKFIRGREKLLSYTFSPLEEIADFVSMLTRRQEQEITVLELPDEIISPTLCCKHIPY